MLGALNLVCLLKSFIGLLHVEHVGEVLVELARHLSLAILQEGPTVTLYLQTLNLIEALMTLAERSNLLVVEYETARN